MNNVLIYTILVLTIIGIIVVALYNKLVALKNEITNLEGAINTLLKKRFDLVPNLVAAAKQYMKHETDIVDKITKSREKMLASNTLEEQMQINDEMNNLLKTFFINVENYPDLKANQNILQLQQALSEIEEQISAARRAYNQAVTNYNNAIEMFPTNIIAKYMNLKPKKVFEITEEEKENINVSKLFKD